MNKQRIVQILVVVLLVASAIVRSNIPWVLAVNSAISVVLAVLILSSKKQFAIIGLVTIISQFLWMSWLEGGEARQILDYEPKAERYAHDTMVFLRIYHLMNDGVSYHQAMATSYAEDTRTVGNPPDLWGFRMPTVFSFWHYLTLGNPQAIYGWFLILSSLALIVSYRITRSLLPPTLLLPYLVVGATTQEFLQMEWWGILPLLSFFNGVVNKNQKLVVMGAILAVLCRETYALPIIGVFFVGLLFKNWQLCKSIILAGIVVIMVFLIHAQSVFTIISLTPEHIFGGRQHVLTLEFIRQVLAYATQRFLFAPYRLFSLYVLFCTGVLLWLWRTKSSHFRTAMYLVFPILLSLTAFLKIGLCCWSDYWGVMIGPLITTATGIMVTFQLKREITAS